MENITVDVKGKSVGRAATEIAVLLRGKNRADFEPRIRPKHQVVVQNAALVKIFPGRMEGKVYTKYSGYPGGFKETTLKEMMKKSPKEVLRRAVWGMLPKNRSRKYIIKNLRFEN